MPRPGIERHVHALGVASAANAASAQAYASAAGCTSSREIGNNVGECLAFTIGKGLRDVAVDQVHHS
ncbi:MAG TPA: hypothetical protein VLR26_01700 [Frankiaceae bacterium]|nr:hypothetical protein [Frankiaceae bacterium]